MARCVACERSFTDSWNSCCLERSGQLVRCLAALLLCCLVCTLLPCVRTPVAAVAVEGSCVFDVAGGVVVSVVVVVYGSVGSFDFFNFVAEEVVVIVTSG